MLLPRQLTVEFLQVLWTSSKLHIRTTIGSTAYKVLSLVGAWQGWWLLSVGSSGTLGCDGNAAGELQGSL